MTTTDVLNYGLKIKCEKDGELIVSGNEDTWIIKGIKGKKLSLWHNNYVITGEKERYITHGFHNQGLDGKSFSFLMEYINNYTFEKHLETKEITKKLEDELAGKDNEVGKVQIEELPNNAESTAPVVSEEKSVKKGFTARVRLFVHKIIKILLES